VFWGRAGLICSLAFGVSAESQFVPVAILWSFVCFYVPLMKKNNKISLLGFAF